ncbi:MAG: hypothetical protein EPO08_07870 [Rhodospirillaceae bacterium]|nr:MAG: hypothetical protein EPO08_07870 [Rhodospirillaceae bacterium]
MSVSLPVNSERRIANLPTGWLAALALGVLVASAVVPRFQARPGATVAAVFPPWWSSDATLRAAMQAGVAIVATSRMPNVVLVSANSVDTLLGLYQTGAWSLIGTDSAAGCFFSSDVIGAAKRTRGP